MRRTESTRACAHPCPLYFFVRARSYIHVGGYARVLSEPANKLVCGGLPHWESFVINLLGGNARTLHPRRCTEVETRRVSNLPGLFLRFLVRESRDCDIQRGILRGISDSVLGFSRHYCSPEENVFTISHNPSVGSGIWLRQADDKFL